MITYDGLRVLMMAEDDSRCCFGLFGSLFQPNNVKIRQGACFFIARLMVMLPDVDIPPKSQQIKKKQSFRKLDFFKFGQIAPYFGDQKLCLPGWF